MRLQLRKQLFQLGLSVVNLCDLLGETQLIGRKDRKLGRNVLLLRSQDLQRL